MKITLKAGFLFWVAGIMSVSARGQALLTVQPVAGNQVQQGQTITLDVFLSNLPQGMRAYQCRFQITPQAGATGTLTLADLTVPGPPLNLINTALFINAPGWPGDGTIPIRPDWVFAPPVPSSALTAIGVPNVEFTGFMFSGTVGPFAVPKYMGTIILRASSNASGNFTVTLTNPDDAGASTFLRVGAGVPIPADVQGTTVTVIPPGPPNDACASATTITNGATNFSTISATTDGPALPLSCDEGDGISMINDVWFNYTATCNGIVTVSTCGSASFDTRLAVYDGDATPSCSCPVGTPVVTCDDDTAGCSNESAEVVLTATQGLCYKIRLGGLSSDPTNTGTGTLSVSCIANDTCATAEVITGTLPQTRLSSTRNTNVDSGLPSCGPFGTATTSGGVWYRVAGTGNVMTASLCGQTTYNSRLSIFSGACASLACVNAVDNNCPSPNGNNETITWCSTSGTQYYILVHGGTNASGNFALVVSDASCNDNNACTVDACVGTTCTHTNTTPAGQCCRPAAPNPGQTCTLNDNNPCTTDSCSAAGDCLHTAVPNAPNAACDDTFRCTLDQCVNGACANTDINTLTCTVTANCPAGTGSICQGGLCRCIENPTLALTPEVGDLPNPSCYSVGSIITIYIEMGFAPNPIVAAQMFLEYDASTLTFLSMDPGRTFDLSSPFSFELQQVVNSSLGTIDYAVGVPPGPGGGTASPALVAVLKFHATNECEPFVRFRSHNPATSLLDSAANPYAPITGNLPEIKINGTIPVVSGCPADMSVGFDPDQYTATVPFNLPSADDSCDGVLPVTCNPPPGSAFSAGTTPVVCTAVNSCGVSETCAFDVSVVPSTMTVDVQLSPTIVPAPRQRCITFDLWHCASGRHATIDAPASFTSGLATDVVVNIPGGQWNCITARDKLHTLRSKSGVLGTVNFQAYDASFVGDLATGGHWLLGGNLNDDNFIDIQDYVRFLQQYLAAPSPNTPCGTLPYHADINGSGTVDVADLSFIQVSMFAGSEAACCPTTVASEGEEIEPLSAVSIKELREKGLGHLGVGDFNGDDVLDLADVEIFLEIQPTFDPLKPDTRVPVLREPLNPGSKSGKPDNDAPRKMSSKSGSR